MLFCNSRPSRDRRLAATIAFVLTFADVGFFEAELANTGTATRTSAVRQVDRPVLAFFHDIEIVVERLELSLGWISGVCCGLMFRINFIFEGTHGNLSLHL